MGAWGTHRPWNYTKAASEHVRAPEKNIKMFIIICAFHSKVGYEPLINK
jgi:hypothetical protein